MGLGLDCQVCLSRFPPSQVLMCLRLTGSRGGGLHGLVVVRRLLSRLRLLVLLTLYTRSFSNIGLAPPLIQGNRHKGDHRAASRWREERASKQGANSKHGLSHRRTLKAARRSRPSSALTTARFDSSSRSRSLGVLRKSASSISMLMRASMSASQSDARPCHPVSIFSAQTSKQARGRLDRAAASVFRL